MPYNGSGTFSPLAAPTYPAVAGEVIYASYFNLVINDILAGLTAAVTRDGQSSLSGDLNFNSHKAIALVAGSAAGHSIEYAQWLTAFTSPPVHPEVATLSDLAATTQVINGSYLETAMARAVTAATLPGQSGNSGKFIKTNGSTASWAALATSDILSGTLGADFGGTGFASYAVGDILYASGAAALSKLAGVATGNVLLSGGVTTAPAWGKVALASAVSGQLPVANGGTGTTTGTGTGANVLGTAPTITTITMSNTDIIGAKVLGLNGDFDNGNSGTAKTILLTNGAVQKITLTANTTLTFDFTAALPGKYRVRYIQDATGGRTVTYSGLSATRWINATSAPTPNTAAAGETWINIDWNGTVATQSLSKVGAV